MTAAGLKLRRNGKKLWIGYEQNDWMENALRRALQYGDTELLEAIVENCPLLGDLSGCELKAGDGMWDESSWKVLRQAAGNKGSCLWPSKGKRRKKTVVLARQPNDKYLNDLMNNPMLDGIFLVCARSSDFRKRKFRLWSM